MLSLSAPDQLELLLYFSVPDQLELLFHFSATDQLELRLIYPFQTAGRVNSTWILSVLVVGLKCLPSIKNSRHCPSKVVLFGLS
jgi:hypothetical protein